MKILLSTIHDHFSGTPLALLYLKSILLKDKYLKERTEVEIKEIYHSYTEDFVLSEIKKYAPQIIGFSCYTWNIKKILELLISIKKINKKVKIVLGGPQVSPIARSLLEKNSQVDIIVRGEGENTFLELIKSLLNHSKDIDTVLGITYRHQGRIIENADRPIIPELDSIPSPYINNFIDLEKREVCLETQRGCVFRCHFCYYHKNFDRVRFFSFERVKKELSFLLKQKLGSIYLMDPVFNSDLKRAKEILRFIIKNNKKNFTFHTEIRAEFVDREFAQLLKRANVTHLEVGLQSSKDRVLHAVNRRLNVKKFVNGVGLLNEYDLNAELQLILGLPTDTVSSFEKSLEFIINLEPKMLSVFRLEVLPGTEIWKKAKRLNIIYDNDPPYYLLQSKGLTFEEIIELKRITNSLGLFRTKKTIKFLIKETKLKLLEIIRLWNVWLNDDKFLLNPSIQDSREIAERFRKFIKYLCKMKKIDFKFYDTLLKKEVIFSIKSEKVQIENKDNPNLAKI